MPDGGGGMLLPAPMTAPAPAAPISSSLFGSSARGDALTLPPLEDPLEDFPLALLKLSSASVALSVHAGCGKRLLLLRPPPLLLRAPAAVLPSADVEAGNAVFDRTASAANLAVTLLLTSLRLSCFFSVGVTSGKTALRRQSMQERCKTCGIKWNTRWTV